MLITHELITWAPRAGHAPIPDIHLVEDHDGAYDVWKAAGVRDRILVHVDGHLDFYWMADRDPEELLAARSSEELNQLLAQVTAWNLDGVPLRDLVHMGNFLYPAIAEGIVRTAYWVIPDPFWASAVQREAVRRELEAVVRLRPSNAGPMEVSDGGISLTVLGRPVTVCTLENLPCFREAVLLDIDVDYLLTWKPGGPPAYFGQNPTTPWLWPTVFLACLKAAELPTDLATIAYSVNGGYTPLRYKYFGDLLAAALADPSRAVANEPPPGTAAQAYAGFLVAVERGEMRTAQERWRTMVALDPSYQTPYATWGCREERARRWRSALRMYDQMIQVDPDWHFPHVARGRLLWRLRQWAEAEDSFQKAAYLSPGPTTATHWLGRCALRRGEWQRAREEWTKAVAENPKDVMSWSALARLATKQGAPSQALVYGRRCVQLGMDGPAIHWHLAWAAWRLGRRRLFRRELGLWGRQLLRALWARGMQGWRLRTSRRTEAYAPWEAGPQADASVV